MTTANSPRHGAPRRAVPRVHAKRCAAEAAYDETRAQALLATIADAVHARRLATTGELTPADIRTLQAFLVMRGYHVGRNGVDGRYGRHTHRSLGAWLAKTQGVTPFLNSPAAKAPATAGALAGKRLAGLGATKDGHRIPRGQGRATVFANGHVAYRGWRDVKNRQNAGRGAWGDRCLPTEYFCALPVGLAGGGDWWHNQKILVTEPVSGKQVVVRVQDKGPHPLTGAAIDLSPVAIEALGGKHDGDLRFVRFEFAPEDAPVGPVR